jgi:hypothetical protein
VYRDQNLVAEMQQRVRAAVTLISDDLRMAGQNIPVYNARFEPAVVEACQTILNGSDGAQIFFRAGTSNVSSVATTPLTFALGVSSQVTVTSAAAFDAAIGGATGRFVFLSGKTPNLFGWVRAEVTAINTGTNQITVTPAQRGAAGSTFVLPMTISLEEAVSYRLSANSVLRGTSSGFTNLMAPAMTEQSIGDDFTALQFVYYDRTGTAINPSTLSSRAQVRRVDVRITGQTLEQLSDGTRPTYSVSVRTFSRNAGVN